MIGCSEHCVNLPCCDFCIHAEHEEWDEVSPTTGQLTHIIGGPIKCLFHKDLKHQQIAESCGYCNDFYCINAQKPDRWIEVNINDT